MAITSEVTLSPGIGWVRGDQAIDPKILQEHERLRIRNAELEKQLDTIVSEEVIFPPNLPPPDSELELRVYAGTRSHDPARAQHKLKFATNWSEIFVLTIDLILKEQDEEDIASAIADHVVKKENMGLREVVWVDFMQIQP